MSNDYAWGASTSSDSIFVTTPYVSLSSSLMGLESSGQSSFEVDGTSVSINLGKDSSVIQVGAKWRVVYPVTLSKIKWDSIIIQQFSVDSRRSLISRLAVYKSGHVQVDGRWSANQENCTSTTMGLRKGIVTEKLINELDWMSPLTFKLLTGEESNVVANIQVEKCHLANCTVFRGLELSANFHHLGRFLDRPFAFIKCGVE